MNAPRPHGLIPAEHLTDFERGELEALGVDLDAPVPAETAQILQSEVEAASIRSGRDVAPGDLDAESRARVAAGIAAARARLLAAGDPAPDPAPALQPAPGASLGLARALADESRAARAAPVADPGAPPDPAPAPAPDPKPAPDGDGDETGLPRRCTHCGYRVDDPHWADRPLTEADLLDYLAADLGGTYVRRVSLFGGRVVAVLRELDAEEIYAAEAQAFADLAAGLARPQLPTRQTDYALALALDRLEVDGQARWVGPAPGRLAEALPPAALAADKAKPDLVRLREHVIGTLLRRSALKSAVHDAFADLQVHLRRLSKAAQSENFPPARGSPG